MSVHFVSPAWKGRSWLPFLLLAMVTLAAHGLSLRVDFYMDDKPHILLNDRVSEGLDAPSRFKSRHLTYAIWRGVHLAFGPNPVAYHAVNLILHLGVVFLFLPVARRVLALRPGLDERTSESVAFWGTLLFAVHPMVSEPVNYAAQTSMLLLSLFATWACYLFLRWNESKRPRDLILTVLAVLLASHAKEPGIFHAGIPLFFMATLTISWDAVRRGLVTNVQARLVCIGLGGALAIVFVAHI